jgi:hypothetical protein
MIILHTAPTAQTRERFQLDFFVAQRSWENLFNRLEVWRSRGTAEGPYELLHGASWSPAVLPQGASGPPPSPPQTGPQVALAGTTLSFLVGAEDIPVTITFSGSNPFTFGAAASQIQEQSNGLLTAFVSGSTLIVQTVEAGAKAVLRCIGGDAAPLLGLAAREPFSIAFGLDARIVLVVGQEQYGFVDANGSPKFFYKARFFNDFNSTVSQFSAPFQGTTVSALSVASLCRGYVRLVDLSGAPAQNQELLVYNEFNGVLAEGAAVTGGSKKILTDEHGRAEIMLVRGTQVTIAIGGTPLARDVTVPTDTTIESINLLSATNSENDVFTVQVPNIPFAVQRHL